ncbi:MAG: Uma2 family endonuclease [Myxococcota bacterium]|nr:Uma2 family endonuclease [Myxococcota bacterium]
MFTSDARLRVLATGLATYPDISIVCGPVERDPESQETLTNPIVLVEVLSESTEGYDREEKLAHYRRIPSLREYVLISQHERRIEHLSRNDDGFWTLRDLTTPSAVALASIGCALEFEDVYGGATPAARAADAPP